MYPSQRARYLIKSQNFLLQLVPISTDNGTKQGKNGQCNLVLVVRHDRGGVPAPVRKEILYL